MGLIKRLLMVIRSNVNALIGRAEDPRKLLEQSLEDMHAHFLRAKHDVARAVSEEKKLRAQLEEQTRGAEEWERRAMLAVNEGRDDLATQALERQAEHAASAQALHTAWSQHGTETAALKESLRNMHERIAELKRKKDVLVARQTRIEAKGRLAQSMTAMNDNDPAATFERMEQKLDSMDVEVEAASALAGELSTDKLEQQFARLEQRDDAQRRLAQLKQKMGKGQGATALQLSAEVFEAESSALQRTGKP